MLVNQILSHRKYLVNNLLLFIKKSVLILGKPIYAGFSILELSKLLMYKFHYDYVKDKFDTKLLFTDTDSLVYEIKEKDVFEVSYSDKYLFDFSNYPVTMQYLVK